MSFRALCLPGRHGSAVQSITKAGDESSSDELTPMKCSTLDHLTDEQEKKTSEDDLLPAQAVADEDCNDSSDQASQVPDANRESEIVGDLKVSRIQRDSALLELVQE
jgi:hypothetical protein